MPRRKQASPKRWKEKRTVYPKLPFSLGNRIAFIRIPVVAVAKLGDTYIALHYSIPYGVVEELYIDSEDIDFDHLGRKKYYVSGDEIRGGPTGLANRTHLPWLKHRALEGGATPDAIRHMTAIMPITKKEASIMAAKEKLQRKSKKAASDDAAPVGKGGKVAKGKGKGNAEALKKARETRAANVGAPDVRKIKVVNKENPYREGSGRAASFDALKGAKTVEDYKSAGGKVKYLSRWESEGRISLS